MSEHRVEIIEIKEVLPHDNAERLEIIPVGGWQAVSGKGNFKPGDRAVYIEPDYMVPTDHPDFAFLAKEGRSHHRLKAVRLRGKLSYGLLIPVPASLQGLPTGSNVMEQLGISRYEPAANAPQGADELAHDQWPRDIYAPKFDIEQYQRYADLIQPGEHVIITEKIHGANARYVYQDGIFYMGSRTRWLKPDGDHIWARAASPEVRGWCAENPGVVLYGEVYGPVQSLKYGLTQPKFAAFAATNQGFWEDQGKLLDDLAIGGVQFAPILYEGPFDENIMKALAERDSVISAKPGQIMEGVVIVPAVERRDDNIGRVALKHISNRYWEFKD